MTGATDVSCVVCKVTDGTDVTFIVSKVTGGTDVTCFVFRVVGGRVIKHVELCEWMASEGLCQMWIHLWGTSALRERL